MTSARDSILILDFKGNLQAKKNDARDRHRIYGARLLKNDCNGNMRLLVFTVGEDEDESFEEEITFKQFSISKFRTLKYIYLSTRELRKNELSVAGLVVSDPWESFLVAKVIMRFLRKKINVQVQVHADISDINWKRGSWKNRLRSVFQGYSLNNAEQIRVVSEDIKNYLETKYRIDLEKIVLAPIPVLISPNIHKAKKIKLGNELDIGFIGRLHWDRGVRTFVEYLEIINSLGFRARVVVAGQGPQEEFLLGSLGNLIGPSQVSYLGQLNSLEVQSAISNLDVYLSLAPSESYGLGIREAIGLDIPVVATKSKGSLQALKIFGDSKIRIIDYPLNSEQVLQSLQWARTWKPGLSSALDIQVESQKHVDVLVNSWIKLANHS